MDKNTNQNRVDELIKHFWENGFLTVKRKYGTYLPEPEQIGEYDVDAVGKKIKNFVIGITISEEDLNNPQTLDKISYLATRHTRYTRKEVLLMIGIPRDIFYKAQKFLSQLDKKIIKNIKLVSLELNKTIN